jgi:SAM-dependent methyltransferase
MCCPREGHDFELKDGIWRFLPPERGAYFAQFSAEYETIRRAEGRGAEDSSYYTTLPFPDPVGRRGWDWRIRAASYRCLVESVIPPLAVASGTGAAPTWGKKCDKVPGGLRVLDLGAGNCWLSFRLAQLGHLPVAVDLLTNAFDGLGAHVHYTGALARPLTCVQAEFERLPFATSQFELAIFNASFHYAVDYEAVLREAMRTLSPRGAVIVVESPIYRVPESGRQMVAEREQAFRARFGFPSNSLPMRNFLTWDDLDTLGRSLGLRWHHFRPRYGLRWRLRPLRARLRGAREPATFTVSVASRT